jgi:methyl-accepting chemotaxis protein
MPRLPRNVQRPRPVLATLRVSREDFDRLHERLEATSAAVERLRQDSLIQAQRTGEIQAALDRLVQHVQALTALSKPHYLE